MKILFPILFILISVAAFLLGVNPFFNDIKILKADITKYNTALSNSTNLQKSEDALIRSYNNVNAEDKDKLNKMLPSTVNNIQFILELERIANLHNMPIKDVKFNPLNNADTPSDSNSNVVASEKNNEDKPYGTFPISFVTEGDYNSFMLFLKDIEKNLRIVDIKSISFFVSDPNTTKDLSSQNNYRYTLEVETYWLK